MLTTRALTAIALTTLLTFHAGVAPLAMEKTATKEVDQQSTDLNTDMKISAFSAAIQAAVNSLIAKVNAFDGRITTVETWRPIIQADVDSLKARVTALESTVGYLYNTWRPWVEGQIASLTNQYNTLNTRVTTLESSPGGGTVVVDTASCYNFPNAGSGSRTCPTDMVMRSLSSNGLTTGAKQWYSSFTGCKLKIQ